MKKFSTIILSTYFIIGTLFVCGQTPTSFTINVSSSDVRQFNTGDTITEFFAPSLVKKTGKTINGSTELLINGQSLWFSRLDLIYAGERDSVGGKIVFDSAVCVMGIVTALSSLADNQPTIISLSGDEDSLANLTIGLVWYLIMAMVGILFVIFGGRWMKLW